MISAHRNTPLKRPNASFMFNAQEWFIANIPLSAAQSGRLFMQILRAVDEKDKEFLARHTRYIGRIYWRDSTTRPPISPVIRRAVIARDGRHCVLCGSDYKIEIDHVFPFSKGGGHELDNLRVLCKPCNRRKGVNVDVSSKV